MKRALLASACLVCLVGVPHAARAQWVVECPTCDQEWTQIFSWIKQAVSVAKQIATAENQLQQAIYLARMVSSVRDLGSAVGAMSALGIQNPLPVDPYAVQRLISGSGGVTGMTNSAASLYTGNMDADTVYLPHADDWQAQRLVQNAASIAGIKTLVQQSYQGAASRLQQLPGLRTAMAGASDPKAVWDTQAHTQLAIADQMSQQTQTTNIATASILQQRLVEQQDEQWQRCQMDKMVAYLRQNEGGIASSAVPNCKAAGGGAVSPDMVAMNQGISTRVNLGQSPLDQMLGTSWGNDAANNAAALGVNPQVLAGTCVIESGCQNVAGPGTASGPFQMISSTYTNDLNQALSQNPSLASQAGGTSSPSTQSIAAAQDLKNAALGLQSAGISNPTFLDTRGYYNFGAGYGTALATADPSVPMSSVLTSYTPQQLAANGVSPSTTVGQWRQGVINKVGSATANAPVLSSA